MLRRIGGLLCVAMVATLAACNNSSGSSATPQLNPGVGQQAAVRQSAQSVMPSSTAVTTKYIQLVIFENESYDDVIGSANAPYITGLSKTWANMTQSFAITHPSQPNYLALFSGSTHGVTSDNCPQSFSTASLGSELIAAGISFTGYAESMPSNGYTGCQAVPDSYASGYLYMRKHVPWINFTKIPKTDSVVYPGVLSAPPSRFTWITPNMCDDMHDCSIKSGDTWASKNLPGLIAWDQANDGVLILTFDENDGSAGNQIPTILIGNVTPGQYSQTINHYSVLRTIENIFGVAAVGKSATATAITGVIK